jgi:uncharacterized membrane protein YdjX (TVP38/TMEM64 family)
MLRNAYIPVWKIFAVVLITAAICFLGRMLYPHILQDGLYVTLVSMRDSFSVWIQTLNPWYLILAFAILTIFGVPIYPFYIAAAAFDPWLMLPAIAVALLFNLAVSYWMALGILNPFITSLMEKRGWVLPKSDSNEYLALLLAVRMCGIPFTIQNWFLALVGVPFRMYLWVSFLIEVVIAGTVMFLGDAILHGRTGGIVFGGCFVMGFIICCYFIRKNWIARFQQLADAE